jgi:hypothetical protein
VEKGGTWVAMRAYLESNDLLLTPGARYLLLLLLLLPT